MTQRRPAGGKGGMRSRNTASPTRQGVAAKELQAARRKKRQKEVMRNRIIFGIVCAALLALLIALIAKFAAAAIATGGAADRSTITFAKDGQVVFEEVEDFDSDTYSKQELKKYTKDLIKSFNDSYGDKSITLKRITFRKGQVYIKTTYKDAECYAAFSTYTTYNGSYEDAAAAGYDFADLFSAVSEGEKAPGQSLDPVATFAGYQVAIVKENVDVIVPGNIIYVSQASTEVVNYHEISISQADGNDDATDLVYIIYSVDKK